MDEARSAMTTDETANLEDLFDLRDTESRDLLDDLMNQKDTALALGISVNTLKAWMVKGELPKPIGIGGFKFYSRREINAAIRARMDARE